MNTLRERRKPRVSSDPHLPARRLPVRRVVRRRRVVLDHFARRCAVVRPRNRPRRVAFAVRLRLA